MAHKKITIDVNGGDDVTVHADLQFQILGSATEGGTYAILAECTYAKLGSANTAGTDATVTFAITGDSVVLDHVDIGTAVWLKYQVKDEAGNESVASVAKVVTAAEYKVNFLLANSEAGTLTGILLSGDFYIEMKIDNPVSANSQYFIGSGIDNINQFSAGRPQVTIGGVTIALPAADTITRAPVIDQVLKYVRTGTSLEIFEGGVSKLVTAVDGSDFSIDRIMKRAAVFVDGTIHWLDINGEMFNMNEGSGATITGSSGTVITLESTGVINDMWEVLP